MINASLNITWSIAEIEASAAGFQAIQPNHFWIGCCKCCDLDYAKFLENAKPEIQNQESQIAQDFQVVRDALTAGKAKKGVSPCVLTSRENLGAGAKWRWRFCELGARYIILQTFRFYRLSGGSPVCTREGAYAPQNEIFAGR